MVEKRDARVVTIKGEGDPGWGGYSRSIVYCYVSPLHKTSRASTHRFIKAFDAALGPAPTKDPGWLSEQDNCLVDHMRAEIVQRVVVFSTSLFPQVGRGLGGLVPVEARGQVHDGS
jgi:hypothetical protein